jgi:hypothetical protein
MKQRTSIDSVEELRRVNAVLAKANDILLKDPVHARMTPNALRVQNAFNEEKVGSEAQIPSSAMIIDDESSGLPKGTKIYIVQAGMMMILEMIKIGDGYKILQAKVVIPAD